jgi:hypothetical protein
MPLEAKGYLTKDGSFFENFEDARYYEATEDLKHVLSQSIQFSEHKNSEIILKLIDFIELNIEEVKEFVSAYRDFKYRADAADEEDTIDMLNKEYNSEHDEQKPPTPKDEESSD